MGHRLSTEDLRATQDTIFEAAGLRAPELPVRRVLEWMALREWTAPGLRLRALEPWAALPELLGLTEQGIDQGLELHRACRQCREHH